MTSGNVSTARRTLAWSALAAAIVVPFVLAAMSPLLAFRQPIYIAAGFTGVIAMALMLLQPLLAGGKLPGLSQQQGRRAHRWIGGTLVAMIILHVGGLWVTSPPDVIDALLFRSPTPFSAWGVVAMWAILGAACLAVFRKGLQLRPRVWRVGHTVFVVIAVSGSVVHDVLIEGTMETVSKAVLCALVLGATATTVAVRRVWKV